MIFPKQYTKYLIDVINTSSNNNEIKVKNLFDDLYGYYNGSDDLDKSLVPINGLLDDYSKVIKMFYPDNNIYSYDEYQKILRDEKINNILY